MFDLSIGGCSLGNGDPEKAIYGPGRRQAWDFVEHGESGELWPTLSPVLPRAPPDLLLYPHAHVCACHVSGLVFGSRTIVTGATEAGPVITCWHLGTR